METKVEAHIDKPKMNSYDYYDLVGMKLLLKKSIGIQSITGKYYTGTLKYLGRYILQVEQLNGKIILIFKSAIESIICLEDVDLKDQPEGPKLVRKYDNGN